MAIFSALLVSRIGVRAAGLVAAAALLGGCARVTGEPEWWDFDDAAVADAPAWAPLLSTEANATRGTNLPATLGASFDPTVFRGDVTRAAAGEAAYAIPPMKATDGAALHVAVRELVAAREGVDAEHLIAAPSGCGPGFAIGCAQEFGELISRQDARLGAALGHSARLVVAVATNVEVVAWTPVRNDFPQVPAVSIAGTRDGRAVGIVVYR
jgi:hypothetical protein